MAGSWKAVAVAFVVLVGCLVAPASAQAKSSPRTDVEVFMRLEATPAQTKAVGAVIRRSHAVRKYRFLTRADTYRDFRARFADEPDLLATTTADQLPTSFRISLAKGAKAKPLVKKLQPLAGVDEVKYLDQNDPRLQKMIERACNRAKKTTVDFEVFLEMDATPAQTSAVRAALNRSSAVKHVKFISKDDAFREMSKLFANSPNLTALLDPAALPASFRVTLRNHAHAKRLTRALESRPGVGSVASAPSLRRQCRRQAIGQTLSSVP